MADLVRRAPARVATRRARQHDRGPRVEYLAFSLGGDSYAAPVARIREILKPPTLTPVPRAPRAILGIISVRGQLITVIDLRRRLGLVERPATNISRILLAEGSGGEILGLFVDEVIQVYRLAETEIESATPALGGEVAGYITGIARPSQGVAVEEKGAHAPKRAGRPQAAPAPAPGARSASETATEVILLLDLRAVIGA
jgi:purine-binding chemotaxis protein CheW